MVDLYTKYVLTVIAVALIAIALEPVFGSNLAQRSPLKVQICDNLRCADLTAMSQTDLEKSAHFGDRYGLPVSSDHPSSLAR